MMIDKDPLAFYSLAASVLTALVAWTLFAPKETSRWRAAVVGGVYVVLTIMVGMVKTEYIIPHINDASVGGVTWVQGVYLLQNGINYVVLLICFAVGTKPRRAVDLCGLSAVAMVIQYYTYSLANALVPRFVTDIPMRADIALLYTLEVILAILIGVAGKRLTVRAKYERYKTIVNTTSGFVVLWISLAPLLTELVRPHIGDFGFMNLTTLYPVFVLVLMFVVMGIAIVVRHMQEYRQLQETQRHIEELNAVLDDSKTSIHDFHKHIRHLQHLVAVHCKTGNMAVLEREVDAYCYELLEHSEKEEMLLQLDDPTLRALLYGRRTQAKAAGITLVLDATSELPHFPVKNYQLVEIVDNLMDNAFDCVSALETERFIRVILSCELLTSDRYRHTLCIQNPYETIDMQRILSGKRYTSKAGNHQGIGLDKVGKIVRETGGQLIISHEDHVFTVRVCYDI